MNMIQVVKSKGEAHDLNWFQNSPRPVVSLVCTERPRNPPSLILAIYSKSCNITVLYHTNEAEMTWDATIMD